MLLISIKTLQQVAPDEADGTLFVFCNQQEIQRVCQELSGVFDFDGACFVTAHDIDQHRFIALAQPPNRDVHVNPATQRGSRLPL